jgi:hypothetical protein
MLATSLLKFLILFLGPFLLEQELWQQYLELDCDNLTLFNLLEQLTVSSLQDLPYYSQLHNSANISGSVLSARSLNAPASGLFPDILNSDGFGKG